MDSEEKIIKGLKFGHEDAYKYIYDHQYKRLCIVACEFVHDSFVAEMIVSDVIFALWKNREDLDINQSLRSYLVKAVRNRCFNYLLRQEKQSEARSVAESQLRKEQNNYEEQHSYPLSQLIEKELDIKINTCIESLPPLTRKIFCLSRFKNLKYDEIALDTGVSVDVVKYHIKSALSRLREGLNDYLPLIFTFLFPFEK